MTEELTKIMRTHPLTAPDDEGAGGGAAQNTGEGEEPASEGETEEAEKPTGIADFASDDDAGETAKSDDTSGEGDGEGQETPKDEGAEGETDDAVPEGDYELEVPEGLQLDEELMKGLTPTFKELGLTTGQAQKLADAYSGHVQAQQEAAVQQRTEMLSGWAKEAKADPEIGKDNWAKSVEHANAALKRFGSDELINNVMSAAEGYGMGNHPELIRVFARIGAAISDDTFDAGTAVDTGKDVPPEDRWYGPPRK